MALARHWRGRPRGLRELPAEVRDGPRYAGKDWWVDAVHLSVCGTWLRVRFDDGLVDYWRFVTGPDTEPDGWAYTTALPPWEAVADGDLISTRVSHPTASKTPSDDEPEETDNEQTRRIAEELGCPLDTGFDPDD